jgi:hypothetical protein
MTAQPSQADLDAKDEVDEATALAAKTVATAAENWLKAIAALTGLLATVAILKGPTEPGKLPDDTVPFIVIGMVVGFLALAVATWLLYSAAYGKPGELNRIRTSPTAGLALRLATAREATARSVLSRTRFGMICAAVAVLVLFAAGLLTLVPQEATEGGGADTVCVTVDGMEVLTISGDSLDVIESADEVTIGGC